MLHLCWRPVIERELSQDLICGKSHNSNYFTLPSAYSCNDDRLDKRPNIVKCIRSGREWWSLYSNVLPPIQYSQLQSPPHIPCLGNHWGWNTYRQKEDKSTTDAFFSILRALCFYGANWRQFILKMVHCAINYQPLIIVISFFVVSMTKFDDVLEFGFNYTVRWFFNEYNK